MKLGNHALLQMWFEILCICWKNCNCAIIFWKCLEIHEIMTVMNEVYFFNMIRNLKMILSHDLMTFGAWFTPTRHNARKHVKKEQNIKNSTFFSANARDMIVGRSHWGGVESGRTGVGTPMGVWSKTLRVRNFEFQQKCYKISSFFFRFRF